MNEDAGYLFDDARFREHLHEPVPATAHRSLTTRHASVTIAAQLQGSLAWMLQSLKDMSMFKQAPRPYRAPSIDFDTPARTKVDTGRSLREELSKDGAAFVTQMAGKAVLAHTAAEFPHVVNKLARFSYQPPLMLKAIDSVLIDDRPSRQGFPFEVVMELGKLRELYGHYVGAGV